MTDFAIETENLSKSYRGQPALTGLDLRVPSGSIFGFLGRNGAGKTTTINVLMGLARGDSGTVSVLGSEIDNPDRAVEVRRRIGFVTEDKDLYPYMTVAQMIRFVRPFFPKWRDDLVDRYVRLFDLPLNKKIPDLSKGMRSKLMLVLAISHEAELLILDEPTDGLDPAAVEDMLRELVAIASSEGTTIFFSSHHLSEVEQIADQVCIIDRGHSVVAGSLDDLKVRYQRLQIAFGGDVRLPVRWADGVEHVHQEGRVISILASRNIDAIVEQTKSMPVISVERFPVSLKEIFLEQVRGN